jgi:hypothetical protein
MARAAASPTVADWLLDPADPGPRYLALRDLYPDSGSELAAARREAHARGPIAEILEKMHPEGYWEKSGAGYGPKYRSGVWSLITLAQLGASLDEDPRLGTAVDYYLDHGLTPAGQFSANGSPGNTIDCLQGNMCAALVDLGVPPERLAAAYDWMARTVTGDGLADKDDRSGAPRYYAYKCGPLFRCGPNNKLPCAWGGVKVMLAFSKLPPERRTPRMEAAIQAGLDFFFSVDPLTADYPCGWAPKPSPNWWKFGFPVFYVTDLLQLAEALGGLGYGGDPRLAGTIDFIREQADAHGRWATRYNYAGKTWSDWGRGGQPGKWVTIRALRVLKNIS